MNISSKMDSTIQVVKRVVEDAILQGGAKGKSAVITSSQTINLLHEAVKDELVALGVNADLIHPPLQASKPEVQIAGFLKFKTQDVCVFPNNMSPLAERITYQGLHTGKNDPYGELFSSQILSINLRSQLSSLAKNIDTMFERTYAEPLNLHRRFPNMVLGEVYLISARELDSNEVAAKRVAYKPITANTQTALQAYIHGFSALNGRRDAGDDYFKYERVALLVVDFSQTPARIYENVADLIADGFLPPSTTCSLQGMSYSGFVSDLLAIYVRRFGLGRLT
jgi:hypothetical protein